MSIFDKFQPIAATLQRLLESGESPFGVVTEELRSATEGVINGHTVILAGTNNYLGLTFAPECIAAAKEALESQGTGTTGSRMANGTYSGHVELERELADFLGTDSAIVFTTGYQATMGVVSTLMGQGDVILLDADSHASIYDGSLRGGAEFLRFRHNNVEDLEKRLSGLGERASKALIVVEGIYSMLGDRAPLREIVEIKRRYGSYLLVDEAHSMGVLGNHGRGLAEEAGVEDEVDFIVGTFSKSLGSVGGFCVSRHPEFELLRYSIRPYIFTASSTPATIASARAALAMVREHPEIREKLWENAHRVYNGLRDLGFRVGPEASPVVATVMDNREHAVTAWNTLLSMGVYVNLVLPPAAPKSSSLLRCSVSAAHTPEQIDRILEAYAVLVGKSDAAADYKVAIT
ncbi:MAG TPA: aminotransferase class I/II-fold pyridoxal phosphate-dependent enzyme [Sedimenticola sp.]|nr:aminotransferase class I/II-fold pyridoxal phosphate-dependent enzyme [Sedimenticola sp.]